MFSNPYLTDTVEVDINIDENYYSEYVRRFQSNLNPLIHEPKRLAILLVLTKNRVLTFTRLQKLLGTSSGNLTNHLKHLVKNKLVEISKTFVETRPSTIISITDKGKEKLKEYSLLFKTTFEVFKP